MLVDLLRAVTTSTGTGPLTLTRKDSHPMPSDHPIFSTVNGLEIGYSIKDGTNVVLETGIGTLSGNGATLTRTYPHTTWNAGTTTLTIAKNTAAINLSAGTYTVEFGLNAANVFGENDVRDAATNRVYLPKHLGNLGTSGFALTAYKVYYCPIKVESLIYTAGVQVRHTGAAAPNYVFALHQRKNNGNPGPIIYSTASAAITTLEGVNNFAWTGGSKMIPAGQYFISMCADAIDNVYRSTTTQGYLPTTLGSNSSTQIGANVQMLSETITAPLAIPPNHGTLSQEYGSNVPTVAFTCA